MFKRNIVIKSLISFKIFRTYNIVTYAMDVTEYILAPNNYNFVELWDEVDEADRKTVELFAFGTFESYFLHNGRFPELNGPMAWKLAQLLVLSVLSEHENSNVKLEAVIELCGVGQGILWWIEHLKSLNQNQSLSQNEVYEVLDEVVKDIIRADAVDVRIDHETDSLVVGEVRTLRDAYDSRIYQLQILEPSDIADRSLGDALDFLRQWKREHIEDTAREFDTRKSPLDRNPRKRKSQVLVS